MTDVFTYNTDNISSEIIEEPYKIYTNNSSCLSKVVPEYTLPIPNPIIRNVIARLFSTIKKYNGLGLSANQCNIFDRVFVLNTDHFKLACINPKIISQSAILQTGKEFCLSFPGLILTITRPREITVEYTNESGNVVNTTYHGLTARIFMHQLDLLNGIPYTSRVGNVALQLATKKANMLLKKASRKK